MLTNYLKIALRNLMKNKAFSLINILGLASGMAICLLALMRIKSAYDYDTFHPNAALTYRINTVVARKGSIQQLTAFSPLPLAAFLKKNNPQIERCTHILFSDEAIATDAKSLPAKEAYVEPDFYNIFGFRLAKGAPATAPQTVVLTPETAKRFFGKADPIGQIVKLGNRGDFIVTGVLAKPPHPSHLSFDVLATMPETSNQFTNWADETAYTYVQLKKGTSKATLGNIIRGASGEAAGLNTDKNKALFFKAQQLAAITPAMTPIITVADEIPFRNLVALALIGSVILLRAFFNYVNLTLARSLDRAREVGVRKVAGALRSQLIYQFLTDSLLTSVLAFFGALLLLNRLRNLPTIQRLTYDVSEDGKLWALFALFAIGTGLVAGWIPARVLSSFQPVRVLKGKFNAKLFGGVGLRKAMTITQFALSLAAMVTLTVFYTQSHYMATADYGFNRDRILTLPVQADSYKRTATAFAGITGVELVSATSELFGFFGGDNKFIKQENDSLAASFYSVTPSFIQAMGLQFVAGSNLPVSNTEREATFVVINEETCRRLKFENPIDAVGKEIRISDSITYRVSGVVKDFHYASFQRFIRPLLMVYNPALFRNLNLKIAAGAVQTIVPKLQATWKKLYPHQALEMTWFDKQLYYQHLHEDDLVFIGLLTGMALSIACLGLLGMVIYTTKNRAKEVSIRKVLGADVWQILTVVAKEFVFMLLIAICIGLPLGSFAGIKFLQQYAYRIPLNAVLLTGCASSLLLLGCITIGWQTYHTAVANPIKNLRTE
ncbi:MAG TPA: ABC transporter permease [Chitinophagaceae bacterium]|nr:ABC transporter permease [Chitinophagaceae bacterium]